MPIQKDFVIFNPYQLEEYGGTTFSKDSLKFRYYSSKKFGWENIYIPYGPVCENENDFKNFILELNKRKFSRVKIDMPVILSEDIKNAFVHQLNSAGFKKKEYILDDETLIVNQNNFGLNSRNMRYVRQGLREFHIRVKSNIDEKEIDEMYEVYSAAVIKKELKPKPKSAFIRVCQNTVSSIAYDNETGKIGGVLVGYINNCPNFINSDKERVQMLQLIFTGLNEKGRDSKLGFALHYELFKECFENLGFDYIDFQGASRTKKESFVEFKKMFGGEFVELPGSFEKLYLL